MTITVVSTAAQLIAVLSGAVAGDTIELAPGTYSNVAITGKSFSALKSGGPSQVYIVSQNANKPAVISDMKVSRSSGIAFVDMKFSTIGDAAGPFGAAGTTPFEISGSSNISMRSISVAGDPNGTLANTMSGIYIHSSSYVTVTASSFTNLHFGIDQFANNHITLTGNSFSHNFDDGIRGGGTSNILISGNTFTDLHFDPTDTDHPDCIQFWTSNTTTSASNITITNNTYTRGAGGAVQGVFMNDEVGNLPYKNVTITGNNLTGNLWNGINLLDIQGGTVSNNKVSWYSDYQAGIHIYGSQHVAVTNNSAGAYAYTGSTLLTLSNNLTNKSLGQAPAPTVPAAMMSAMMFSTSTEAVSDEGKFIMEPMFGDAAAVPEPRVWSLMAFAFGFLGLLLRGKRVSTKALC